MSNFRKVIGALNKKERFYLGIMALVFIVSALGRITFAVKEKSEIVPVAGGSYIEGVIGQPRFLNPIISTNPVDQDISALIYGKLGDFLDDKKTTEDNRVFNIKIKENLKWDDGTPLTSDDIIFTIKTAQNPENRSPFLKSWQGVIVKRISELRLSLSLPTAYVFFPKILERLPIIPKHIFESIPKENLSLSAYNLRPVGAGPYRFSDFSSRQDGFITKYHLVQNDNFAGAKKPFIKDFFFHFFEKEEELIKAYKLRKINGFGKTLPPNKEIFDLANTKISKIPMPRYYAVFLNQIANAALKEKDIRQALALSSPISKITSEIFLGEAKPVTGPIFRNLLDLPEPLFKNQYNLEEAQKLIQKFKSSNKSRRLEFNLIVPQIEIFEKTAEMLKTAWLTAGLDKIDILYLNTDDFLNEVLKTRNYDMVIFGNVLENPADLYPFWHSSQRFYPDLNLSLYQNVEVDKLIETIRQTDDENKRKELLEELDKKFFDDVPAIFLFSLPYYYIYTDQLEGFEPTSIIMPADRFSNVSSWNLIRARVLKNK